MRILITGGFGFVGSALAVHLAQAGHQVILGSRHSMPPPEWLPQAEVVKIRWNDDEPLEDSCKGVDVIIHSAGMNAQDCAADPVAALAFNGLATAKLVASAKRFRIKKFIYLSTAHVYSSPLVGVITEETYPRNLHAYATSHLAGENAVLTSNSCGELQGIVLRLSNAFGVPMHKDVNCWMLLVNDLCKQAVETRKLVLQSSGLQERDFISLADLGSVIEKLLTHHLLVQENILNVGAGLSLTVLEMAKLIQRRCTIVLGFTPELAYKQTLEGETHTGLTYVVDKLVKLNCNVNQNISKEIDKLLLFCKK